MFKTRVISSVVLVAIAAVVLYLGGYVTGAVMLLLSLVGIFELLRVYRLEKSFMGLVAYVSTIVYYVLLMFKANALILPFMIVYLLVVLAAYVLTFPKFKDKDMQITFLSFFYISVMLSYVYQLRALENGLVLVLLIIICSWGNDTLAYLVGVSIGKHKMSPKLSPKKSIEGLLGGIVGAGLLGGLFGLLFGRRFVPNHYVLWFVLIGAVGAIPAVIGDLAASAIKRDNKVKDYGKLIPGHGGVMDRFDSMIFVAPIIYYLVIMITK
ncbi:MAG: phosphatidate cytidylyltransferase [Eubacterium sp.]|nr:phosphatidate cytidylyltransferase [Eubacterium sp.]